MVAYFRLCVAMCLHVRECPRKSMSIGRESEVVCHISKGRYKAWLSVGTWKEIELHNELKALLMPGRATEGNVCREKRKPFLEFIREAEHSNDFATIYCITKKLAGGNNHFDVPVAFPSTIMSNWRYRRSASPRFLTVLLPLKLYLWFCLSGYSL